MTTAPRDGLTRGLHGRFLRPFATSALVVGLVGAGALATAPIATASTACTPDSGYGACERFSFTGADQSFTVPAGVTSVHVEVWGAGGGGSEFVPASGFEAAGGAAGGYGKAQLAVTEGEVLTIVAGGAGQYDVNAGTAVFGGGGLSAGGAGSRGASGGGFSGVFLGAGWTSPQLIAGAGGGGNAVTLDGIQAGAGGGAGLAGNNGSGTGGSVNSSGSGGTLVAGGAAATGNFGPCATTPPQPGAQWQGGDGAIGGENGAGGGGGYFGGGGGLCNGGGNDQQNGGGGGGSGFATGDRVSAATGENGTNGTVSSATSQPRVSPGGTSSAQYVAGVGAGGATGPASGSEDQANGGAGMVVVQYSPASADAGSLVVSPRKNTNLPRYGSTTLVKSAKVTPSSSGSLRSIRVTCTLTGKAQQRGDMRVKLCSVKKNLKTGRVAVKTNGYRHVRVTVTIKSKSTTASYTPQTWKRSWHVK